jgi:hypothetical protein
MVSPLSLSKSASIKPNHRYKNESSDLGSWNFYRMLQQPHESLIATFSSHIIENFCYFVAC